MTQINNSILAYYKALTSDVVYTVLKMKTDRMMLNQSFNERLIGLSYVTEDTANQDLIEARLLQDQPLFILTQSGRLTIVHPKLEIIDRLTDYFTGIYIPNITNETILEQVLYAVYIHGESVVLSFLDIVKEVKLNNMVVDYCTVKNNHIVDLIETTQEIIELARAKKEEEIEKLIQSFSEESVRQILTEIDEIV